jgi:hypothetical protein
MGSFSSSVVVVVVVVVYVETDWVVADRPVSVLDRWDLKFELNYIVFDGTALDPSCPLDFY